MGDYPANRLAVSFYGVVMFMMALGFVLIRAQMYRGADLIQEHADHLVCRTGTHYAIAFGPVDYALGAGLAWVNVIAAFICYASIALYFVLSPLGGGAPIGVPYVVGGYITALLVHFLNVLCKPSSKEC